MTKLAWLKFSNIKKLSAVLITLPVLSIFATSAYADQTISDNLIVTGQFTSQDGALITGTSGTTGNYLDIQNGTSNVFSIDSSGNITATGSLTGLTGLSVDSGTVSFPSGSINVTSLTHGTSGKILQTVSGVPTWVNVPACSSCLVSSSSGSQTIQPSSATGTLIIAQGNGNTSDIFTVVDSSGTEKYLNVTQDGTTIVGSVTMSSLPSGLLHTNSSGVLSSTKVSNSDLNSGSFSNITGLGTLGSLTASGTITFSGLSTGVIHSSSSGVLSSSTISNSDLASGSYSNITGVGALSSLTISGQITSTVSTGTAPLSISSTTPVSNLTAGPTAYDIAGNQRTNSHIVTGQATIGMLGTAVVGLTSPASFSSASSYVCTTQGQNSTTAIKLTQNSGSQFSITATVNDTVSYICIGN